VGSSPTGLTNIPRKAGETAARHARARKKAIGKPERKEAEKKQKEHENETSFESQLAVFSVS